MYIDSPLIFNVIKRERGLWADSLKVLLAGERGDIQLVSSTLLLAEVCGFRGDVDVTKRDDVLHQYIAQQVEWIEVDQFVIRDARKVADVHRLRGLDATHLASAVRLRARYFMTRVLAFPIGQVVDGVKVMQPDSIWNETLQDLDVDTEATAEEAAFQKAEQASSRPSTPTNEINVQTPEPTQQTAPPSRLMQA